MIKRLERNAVADPQALFAGASAEGQVETSSSTTTRFSSSFKPIGPAPITLAMAVRSLMDIIRPIGQTGRDLIDDWMPMVGLGRIIAPETVEVFDDGRNGIGVVRTVGRCVSFHCEGALENRSFIQDYSATTDFILEPNSHLRMESTVDWDTNTTLQMGDFEWWPSRSLTFGIHRLA